MQASKKRVLNWATMGTVFAFSMPAQAVPGDMDLDSDVDLADYALFRGCFMGPQIPVVEPGCQNALFDADSDVDLQDLAGFQSAFTGSCSGPLPNDRCQCPIDVAEGTLSYRNVGAGTDGLEDPACDFLYSDGGQVGSDIWYCYTASCTGTALVSLCGSDYDTKLAVYEGCGCPTTAPLACSDDDCGVGVENVQSRVEVPVTKGQRYMVRVGGFAGLQGDGRLTIGCNVDACANGSGNCFEPSPTGAPGCGDPPDCCTATCTLDQFCCDVSWDPTCAGEALGVCTGSFPACVPGSGPCDTPDAAPGCEYVDCCNRICLVDPYCCLTAWDGNCVAEAQSMCFLTCGPGAGNCREVHTTPGCDVVSCCEAVCNFDDFCCTTEWDEFCVGYTVKLCP